MPVHVVTDSTADIDPEEAAALGITVVPLNLLFGTENLRDQIDIRADAFLRRLITERTLPKTSQPAPAAFLRAFSEAFTNGADAVVAVHISGKLSGTVNAARTAAETLKDPATVTLVDSGTVSAALAYSVRAAAVCAREGGSAAQVAAAARDAVGRTNLLVVLDTLEYLQKGGRIGRARAWFGGVLNIKPLLSVVDGEVVPVERVRTNARAVARLIELTAARENIEEITIMHSIVSGDLGDFPDRVGAAVAGVPVRVGWLGPVVGVYAGPNALGMVSLQRSAPAP